MSTHTLQSLPGMAPWSAFDNITVGGLIVLLLIMLRRDWTAPIPLLTLIGLIVGLLLGVSLEVVSSSGTSVVSARTRDPLIGGMVLGLLVGLIGRMLWSPLPNNQPAANQPDDKTNNS